MHVCVYVCMYVCVCMWMCAYVCMCVCVVYACMHACMHVCMYVNGTSNHDPTSYGRTEATLFAHRYDVGRYGRGGYEKQTDGRTDKDGKKQYRCMGKAKAKSR